MLTKSAWGRPAAGRWTKAMVLTSIGWLAAGGGAVRSAEPEWEQMNVPPRTTDFYGLWMHGDQMIAVGVDSAINSGIIYRFDGTAWASTIPSNNYALWDVWGSSPSDVFAVGNGGVIHHYNGTSWAEMLPISSVSLHAVWGSGPNDVFAVGTYGTILHYAGPSTPGFSEWSVMNSGTGDWLFGVWGSGPQDVYAVGDSGLILHFDGKAWSTLTTGGPRLNAISGIGPGDYMAVGDKGIIWHAEPDGWLMMQSGTTERLHGVWYESKGLACAVGDSGLVLSFDGTSWKKGTCESDRNLFAAAGPADNYTGMAAGVGGTIVQQMSNPRTDWRRVSRTPFETFRGVWGTSLNEVFAVGDGGCALRFDGVDWVQTPSGTLHEIVNVWGLSSTQVYAVVSECVDCEASYFGELRRYDGTSWVDVPGTVGSGWGDVWGTGPNDLYVVGQFGHILHYDGKKWTEMASGTDAHLTGIWGSAANNVFAVGYSGESGLGGVILQFDGSNWLPFVLNLPGWSPPIVMSFYDVWGASATHVLAAGETGMLRFDGSNWTVVPELNGLRMDRVWGSGSNDVFAAGKSGIWHSDGSSWRKMEKGTDDRIFAIWGSGPKDVFAAGERGTILHYPRNPAASGSCCGPGLGTSLPIISTALVIRFLPRPRRRRTRSGGGG